MEAEKHGAYQMRNFELSGYLQMKKLLISIWKWGLNNIHDHLFGERR